MPEFAHLKEWLKLPDETKLNIFTEQVEFVVTAGCG